MSISIIIVTWNSAETIVRLLEALGRRHEIIVVDNGSSDDTPKLVRKESRARLIEPGRNLGFGAACNIGVQAATGDIVVFLNPDTAPHEDAIDALAAQLADPQNGICLPALSNSITEVRDTVGGFPSLHFAFLEASGIWALYKRFKVRSGRRIRIAWGFGACMAMRRTTFEAVNGFDESLFLYGEDADLCRRVSDTGCVVTLDTRIVVPHIGNHSGQQAFEDTERARLVLRSDYHFLEKFGSRRYALVTFRVRRLLLPLRMLACPNSALYKVLRDGSWQEEPTPPSQKRRPARSRTT